MAEPNIQVTASPVSAFTTFGKGAPAAPAAPAGAPAQPIDTLTPIANQFQALSETAFKYFQGVQQREDQEALTIAEREAQNLEIEQLAQLRKDNALNYASLVDKGLMDATENPWAEVGAKRGLAKLNSRMARAEINSNLALDFEKNTDQLQSAADPVAAMSAYIQSKLNPLGLDEATINDYYYASNFEKEFGQVLESATNSLVKLRLEKGQSDALIALRNDVVDALAGGPVMKGANEPRADFGLPEDAPTKTERIEALLSDYRYRGHLGNETHERVVGSYLLELAKDGDIDADQALKEARLSNGKRLFDTMKGEYELASSTIEAAQSRVFGEGLAVRNQALEESVKDHFIQRFAELPVFDDDQIDIIAQQTGGLVSKTAEGWAINLPTKEGTVRQVSLNIDTLRKQAGKVAFKRNFDSLVTEGLDPMTARIKAAAITNRYHGGHVDTQLQATFTNSIGAINELMSNPEADDVTAALAMDGLMHYRRMRAEVGLEAAYLSADEQATFYLLDLLEQGSQGPLGQLSENQIPSGMVSAISRLKGVDTKAFGPEQTKLRQAFGKLPERLMGDIGLIDQLVQIGSLQVALTGRDGEDIAEEILDNFVQQGDNYIFSPLTGPVITDPDTLLSTAVEFAADMSNKAAEGSIAADIRAIADLEAIPVEDQPDWIRENIHFVGAKGPQKALMIANKDGIMWEGSRLYTAEALRSDLEIRTSAESTAKQEAEIQKREELKKTDQPAPENFIRSIKEPFIMQGVRAQDATFFRDKMEGGFNSPEEIKEMQKKHRETIEGAFDPLNSVRFPTDRQVIDTFMDVVNWIGSFIPTADPDSAIGRAKGKDK